MKSHLVKPQRDGYFLITLCGKRIHTDKAKPCRLAKRCKKCKRLNKKDWICKV